MATPIVNKSVLRFLHPTKHNSKCLAWNIFQRNASWKNFFRKSKDQEEVEEESVLKTRKFTKFDGPSTRDLNNLRMKTVECSVRGYDPPSDVEDKIISVTKDIVGSDVSADFKLDDRMIKFQLLTSLMQEFDHQIPNTTLTEMSSLSDVITFFLTPVRERSVYDDMTRLNLPKNLHIQLEPVRFNADTDTFFDGKSAFFDSPTIVKDIKYSRKYKGNQGESRNSRTLTHYEKQQIFEAERRESKYYDKIPFAGKVLPAEGIYKKRNYKSGGAETEKPII